MSHFPMCLLKSHWQLVLLNSIFVSVTSICPSCSSDGWSVGRTVGHSICHNFQRAGSYIFLLLLLNTCLDEGLVYFHSKGELMQKYLRNPYLFIKAQRDNVNVELDISVLSILDSQLEDCSSQEYDECVMHEIKDKLMRTISCWPSFLDNLSNASTCQNFDKGLNALEIFNDAKTNCKFPCYQINIDSRLSTTRPVINTIHQDVNFTKTPGYVFYMPKNVKLSEMVESYDILSYMAEFGGWSGLFVGISVLTITFALIDNLNMKNKKAEKGAKLMLTSFSIIMLFYVLIESIIKLLEKPIGEKISFNQNYGDISLSICNEESPLINDQFVAEDWQFWNYGSDISTMIERIELIYANNRMRTLKTTKKEIVGEIMSLDEVKSQNMINNNGDVEFCHTFPVTGVRFIKLSFIKVSFI